MAGKKKGGRRRGRVEVDAGRCKGCGLCLRFCRAGALRLGDGLNARGLEFVVADERAACNACAVCALVCPDAALTVFQAAEEDGLAP